MLGNLWRAIPARTKGLVAFFAAAAEWLADKFYGDALFGWVRPMIERVANPDIVLSILDWAVPAALVGVGLYFFFWRPRSAAAAVTDGDALHLHMQMSPVDRREVAFYAGWSPNEYFHLEFTDRENLSDIGNFPSNGHSSINIWLSNTTNNDLFNIDVNFYFKDDTMKIVKSSELFKSFVKKSDNRSMFMQSPYGSFIMIPISVGSSIKIPFLAAKDKIKIEVPSEIVYLICLRALISTSEINQRKNINPKLLEDMSILLEDSIFEMCRIHINYTNSNKKREKKRLKMQTWLQSNLSLIKRHRNPETGTLESEPGGVMASLRNVHVSSDDREVR